MRRISLCARCARQFYIYAAEAPMYERTANTQHTLSLIYSHYTSRAHTTTTYSISNTYNQLSGIHAREATHKASSRRECLLYLHWRIYTAYKFYFFFFRLCVFHISLAYKWRVVTVRGSLSVSVEQVAHTKYFYCIHLSFAVESTKNQIESLNRHFSYFFFDRARLFFRIQFRLSKNLTVTQHLLASHTIFVFILRFQNKSETKLRCNTHGVSKTNLFNYQSKIVQCDVYENCIWVGRQRTKRNYSENNFYHKAGV